MHLMVHAGKNAQACALYRVLTTSTSLAYCHVHKMPPPISISAHGKRPVWRNQRVVVECPWVLTRETTVYTCMFLIMWRFFLLSVHGSSLDDFQQALTVPQAQLERVEII